jgi:branched-chain amino acid transport system substrate-binding protein
MKRLVAFAALAVALGGCEKTSPRAPATSTGSSTNTAAPASDVWLIGEVGSLSGQQATFGQSTEHGIELAMKEVNAAGGVKGKKFKVVTYDDQGKPDEAASATLRLISQDHVQLVLGEVASTNSKAMAGPCQNNKVPMITPSSTNPEVTTVGDYIFRVCFIDPFQGTVMAKFAHDNLKLTRVAILKDVRSD